MNKLTQLVVTGIVGGVVVLGGMMMVGQGETPAKNTKPSVDIEQTVRQMQQDASEEDKKSAATFPVIVVAAGNQWLCVSTDGRTHIVDADGFAHDVSVIENETTDEPLFYGFNPRYPNKEPLAKSLLLILMDKKKSTTEPGK